MTFSKRRAFLALLSLTTPSLALATPAPISTTALSEAEAVLQIRAMLEKSYPADGPGAAVIVTRGEKTLFAGGRGLADVATKRPAGVEVPFQLASITKVFTAALVAKLAAEGKLKLDDPISKYVPDLPAPASSATIRHLLNHNSGIMDYSKVPNFITANRDKVFTTAELVAVMRELKPVAAPGEKWEYNNGGYALLGAVIEKVTGESWQEALQARIARPLGLTSIVASNRPAGIATPYGGADAKAEAFPIGETSIAGAGGAMIASAADLARFFNALHHGRIIPDNLYRLAVAPAPMNDGKTMPYGFGFRLGKLLDRPIYYQGGAMRGARTETLYLPQQEVFVAVLANSDEPQSQPRELAQRIAAIAIGAPLPLFTEVKTPIEQLRPLLGRYVDAKGSERLLFERNGSLWLAVGNSSARQVYSAGNDRFYFGNDELAWFEAKRDPGGKHRLTVHVPETREVRQAVWAGDVASAAVKVDPALLRRYAGTYLTETDVTLRIKMEAAGLTIGPDGQEPAALRAIDGGEFAVDGSPMRIAFDLSGDRITGLRMFRGARVIKAVRKD